MNDGEGLAMEKPRESGRAGQWRQVVARGITDTHSNT